MITILFSIVGLLNAIHRKTTSVNCIFIYFYRSLLVMAMEEFFQFWYFIFSLWLTKKYLREILKKEKIF